MVDFRCPYCSKKGNTTSFGLFSIKCPNCEKEVAIWHPNEGDFQVSRLYKGIALDFPIIWSSENYSLRLEFKLINTDTHLVYEGRFTNNHMQEKQSFTIIFSTVNKNFGNPITIETFITEQYELIAKAENRLKEVVIDTRKDI